MMDAMFLDETTGKWLAIAVLTTVSVALIGGSRHQPPAKSQVVGWTVATITGLQLRGRDGTSSDVAPLILVVVLVLGSYGVLVEVHG